MVGTGQVSIQGFRSIENPSTPLSSPDAWLFDALGSGPSSSGINVSRTTALTFAAVWRAVNLIGDALGKCPLMVHRREVQGGRGAAVSHPAYRLLRRKPNDYMTAFLFKKLLQHHVLFEGNGYAYIERNGGGLPLALLPLNPDLTHPVREANGQLWYVYDHANRMSRLRPEDVLHIRGLSFDGLVGYSVIAKARESLGLGMAAQRYGSVFFRNGSSPHIALEVPGRMTQLARDNLRNSWERAHAGLDNAHKVALLEEGVKLNQYSVKAKDAQLLELLQASIRDVANWFGLPPHKLGDNSRTAYNTLEQENQSCLEECYDPWMVVWEEECHDKLLTEDEKAAESHEVEYARKRLVQPALGTKVTYWNTGLQNGTLTRDEVREEDGRNPLPDGQGGVVEPEPEPKPGQKKSPAAGSDDEEEGQGDGRAAELLAANRETVLDAARRMARRVATHARREAQTHARFAAWLGRLQVEHGGVAEQAFTPAVKPLNLLTGRAVSPARAAEELLFRVGQVLMIVSERAEPGELKAAVDAAAARLETAGDYPTLMNLWEDDPWNNAA